MIKVELSSGYIGKTRSGGRAEIVAENVRLSTGEFYFTSSDGRRYFEDGRQLDCENSEHQIIGPWVDEPVAPAPNCNDGGNAFPACNEANVNQTMGMTLRDYFAAQVLPQICCHTYAADAAKEAYEYADAMIAAREVQP